MKRAGVFIAALAIALHALWPLIAQAKPKSVHLVPLCTVAGVTHFAEIPGGTAPAEEQSAAHFEHCALCTLGSDRVLSPSLLDWLLLSPQSVSRALPQAQCAPRGTAIFPAARQRAPPAGS